MMGDKRPLGFDEGYKRGLEDALAAIAALPTPRSEDIMVGHEQAYRAIEALARSGGR